MPAPRVTVIVPALDAARTIGETLAGLAEQDLGEAFEVIVVDNGSTDATAEIARAAPLGARVLCKERDRAGTARNLGAAEARGGVLAFTDADCRPEPGWLREGLAAIAAADIVQGGVRPFSEAPRAPFDRTLWVTDDHGLFETANLLVRRELFEAVGGFEDWSTATDLAVPFGEDTWFGWRARRAGARVAFAPTAVVEHAVFARGVREFAQERRRAAQFPALVARIPELRESLLYRRWFLSRRSARLDVAALGLATAVCARRLWPLGAALPYAVAVGRSTARWRSSGPRAAAGEVLADVTTLRALVSGSIRHRTPVL